MMLIPIKDVTVISVSRSVNVGNALIYLKNSHSFLFFGTQCQTCVSLTPP